MRGNEDGYAKQETNDCGSGSAPLPEVPAALLNQLVKDSMTSVRAVGRADRGREVLAQRDSMI